jgi:hypothetical protein
MPRVAGDRVFFSCLVSLFLSFVSRALHVTSRCWVSGDGTPCGAARGVRVCMCVSVNTRRGSGREEKKKRPRRQGGAPPPPFPPRVLPTPRIGTSASPEHTTHRARTRTQTDTDTQNHRATPPSVHAVLRSVSTRTIAASPADSTTCRGRSAVCSQSKGRPHKHRGTSIHTEAQAFAHAQAYTQTAAGAYHFVPGEQAAGIVLIWCGHAGIQVLHQHVQRVRVKRAHHPSNLCALH